MCSPRTERKFQHIWESGDWAQGWYPFQGKGCPLLRYDRLPRSLPYPGFNDQKVPKANPE